MLKIKKSTPMGKNLINLFPKSPVFMSEKTGLRAPFKKKGVCGAQYIKKSPVCNFIAQNALGIETTYV